MPLSLRERGVGSREPCVEHRAHARARCAWWERGSHAKRCTDGAVRAIACAMPLVNKYNLRSLLLTREEGL